MKKVNFFVPVTDLSGKELKQGNDVVMINELTANQLSISRPIKSAIKQLDLALKIFNTKEEMELSDEDILIIKQVIEQSNSITTLVSGQILKLLV